MVLVPKKMPKRLRNKNCMKKSLRHRGRDNIKDLDTSGKIGGDDPRSLQVEADGQRPP